MKEDVMPPKNRDADDIVETVAAVPAGWVSPPLSVCPDHLPDRVPARWVDVQAVFNRDQGLICYGDPIWVSDEQLAEDSRLVAWADDFTPDPAALAASQLEG